ncbi:MAG: undecaprenyl-phosphate glucose phosphotransferase [Planctomycetia bacterium]|nr:undecaprenyl-phosphate glucose phosphotransferase [Planctomycetia bacterium]
MYRRHGNKLRWVFMGCDLAVTAVVWLGAYVLRFSYWPSPNGVPDTHLVFEALPLVLVAAAAAYHWAGLYEIHRLKPLPREISVVCRAGGLLFLMAITVAFYRRDLYESRLALALFLVLNAVGLTLVRRAVWRAVRYLRSRGMNYGRALIVGTGRPGRLLAATLRDNDWTGLEPVGFVDDVKVEPTCYPLLGTLDRLEQIVAEHDVDHVFIALPLSRYGELPRVYDALSHVLAEVQLVPDVPSLAGMKLQMMEIDDVGFLSLRRDPHRGWARVAKRATDLALGTTALALLGPLMLGLAVAVKLSSRGPVLYRQTRAGLGRRPFAMFKFRTMHCDAEHLTGPVWATRNDRRCTRLGRFMRRWSLDELPQLLNVLAGDMSLVGPRPERGFFVEEFRDRIPGYDQRHRVKAGMTGWAQVHGWRGNTSLRHRVQCDLYYIANWSLALDLKILLMTLWCGVRHRNAY